MKTMIKTVAVLVLALSATSAFATNKPCKGNPPPNCKCDTSTGTWVQNNNSNVNTNHNSAVAGASASAGAVANATGGNAVAAGGAGGSVVGSGNSTNTNTVTGGNATIQSGAVKNDVKNTSTSSADLTNVGNSSSTANANNNGNNNGNGNGSNNVTVAAASADGAGTNNGNNSNNTETTVNNNTTYKAAKIPVSTAYAAGLTSGMDTCLGSASAGVQTAALGVSVGKTTVDKNCVTIKRTHLIAEFSVPAGCAYMLKNVPGAREAFDEVGAVCVPPAVEVVAVGPPAPPVVVLKEVPPKKPGE